MKKIIVLLALAIIIPGVACGEERNPINYDQFIYEKMQRLIDQQGDLTIRAPEKTATYEIKITIKYNAVTEREAAEINRKALAEHGEGACQVEVKIKKKRDDSNNLDITGTGDIIFHNPGDIIGYSTD